MHTKFSDLSFANCDAQKSRDLMVKHVFSWNLRCYICLVEYEEADSIRTLPCHHEFHKTCVDKWLKEIHRYECDI